MRNDNIIEAIEAHLATALELGLDTEEALADTAGLISEAEARFVRLSHPGSSFPPPARA
jgi:hypothetical protein